MASVKEHYDHFLGPYYSWISGGLAGKVAENRKFFLDHHIRPGASRAAVDLGAGSGFQTIPLAEAGFRVTAIDANEGLLAELANNAAGLPVVTVKDDLLHFPRHIPDRNELIVCMGDTLTHLQRLQDVQTLLEKAFHALDVQGRLILDFRDLSVELFELDRFIPVRSDANRIFTCFLEYEEKHVKVHDILYERDHDGWRMKKSFFRKLRISSQWIKNLLRDVGFEIETFEVGKGRVTLVARRP